MKCISARTVGFVGLAIFALIPAIQLHPVYFRQSVGVGQGAFEPSPHGIILRYNNKTSEMLVPTLTPVHGSKLLVAPGATLVIPVGKEPVEIRGANPDLAPWIVVGEEGTDVISRLTNIDEEWHGHQLVATSVPAIVDGTLRLVPWNPLTPWTVESRRLHELRDVCGANVLHVEQFAGQSVLRFGTCIVPLPEGERAHESLQRIAVTGDAMLVRPGLAWPVEHKLVWQLLVAVILLLAAQVIAFGLRLTGLIAFTCTIASIWTPEASSFAWLLVGFVATGRLAWQVVRELAKRAATRFRWGGANLTPGVNRWRTATWIGVAIAVALAVLPALNATYLQPRSPVPSAIGDRAELVVTGYSTAGNASLPDKLWGINNYLDRECTACAGKTGTLVESGQSFGWIRSNVCSDVLPDETTRVLFIGGDNDDLLQTQGRFEAAVMQLTLMVHFAMSDATDFQTWVDRWAGAFERNGARRLKDTAESAEIEMAMSCAREHHQTFYYFHDFLVTDLHGGRGANRQRLLERRRQVVEAGGGIFVDLLAVFGAGAGVSWFNDFIHPSAVGHQKIGKLMCQMLGPSQPPSVPMPEWTAPDQMPIGKMFGKVSLLHDGPAVATSEPRSAALRDRTKPRPETLVVYP